MGGKESDYVACKALNWERINSAYNKSLLTSSLKASCSPKPGGIFSWPRRKLHKRWLLFECATFIWEILKGFPYRVWTNSIENSYPPKTNKDWLITYYHILQLRLWKMCNRRRPVCTSLIFNLYMGLSRKKKKSKKKIKDSKSSSHGLKKGMFFSVLSGEELLICQLWRRFLDHVAHSLLSRYWLICSLQRP